MQIPESQLSNEDLLTAAVNSADELYNATPDTTPESRLEAYVIVLQALDRLSKLARAEWVSRGTIL